VSSALLDLVTDATLAVWLAVLAYGLWKLIRAGRGKGHD
jgi:hypothetical protein